MPLRIEVDRNAIAAFCRKWKVVELSFFGSVLRDDFRAGSDVDLLVKFAPDAGHGLLDHVAMEEELSSIMGRRVDMVTRSSVERSRNHIRRRAILSTAEIFYAA